MILGALNGYFFYSPFKRERITALHTPSPLSPPEQGAEAGSQNEG